MKRLLILHVFIFTLSLAKTLLVPECYSTIQQAILSASNGDTVSILSDTYFQHDRLNINEKNVFIQNRSLSGKFRKTEIIPHLETFKNQRTQLRGWEGQRLVNRLDSVSDLAGDIACDQQSIPWVVWGGALTQSGSNQIFFTRWNGTNWNDEQMVHPIDTFYNYQPRITFDGEDRPWVIWTREEGVPGHGDWEIFYTKWGGNGWDQKQQLNPTNLLRKDIAKGIGYGGNEIWVVTTSYNRNMDSCAVFTSHWNGINWDTLFRVSPDSGQHWFSAVAVDNSGRPHIVWCEPISGRIYYRTRNDISWTAPVCINDTNTIRCASWAAPQIAIDNIGNLHVAWVGVASGENDQDIFYSKYDGQQWVAPVRLNINDNDDEYYPDIALSSSNNIWVTWDKQLSFWVSHPYVKHFDGNSWSTEEKLDNDSISYFNASNRSALDPLGNPWVIWEGMTSGIDHFDVYSNRYTVTSISEKSLTTTYISAVQVSPNPFRFSTTIAYSAYPTSQTTLDIFNVDGKLIKRIVSRLSKPRQNMVRWDGTDENSQNVRSGVYLCKISNNSFTVIKKLILIK